MKTNTRLSPLTNPRRLISIANSQGGVVTRAQVRSTKITNRGIRKRLQLGIWQELLGCILPTPPNRTSSPEESIESVDSPTPGEWSDFYETALCWPTVPVVSFAPEVTEGWAMKLRVGCKPMVISGITALQLGGPTPPPELMHGKGEKIVLAERGCFRRIPGVSLRAIQPTLQPVRGHWQGLRYQSASDAVIDIIQEVTHERAIGWCNWALWQRFLTVHQIQKAIELRPACGRKGLHRLRAALKYAKSGTRSEAELMLTRHLKNWKIMDFVADYPVQRARDKRPFARLDFAYPPGRLALEVDGHAYHSPRSAFERDRDRQNDLAGIGWSVLRFTWNMLKKDPEYVHRTVLAGLAMCARRAAQRRELAVVPG